MSVNKDEIRRRRTEAVGKLSKEGRIDTPNGRNGRSQKGCFGGKGVINAKRHNA